MRDTLESWWKRVQTWWRSWWTLPRRIGLLAVVLGFVHYLPLPTLPIPWLIALHADLAPELIGIGLTVILIDWAVARQAKIERKAQLIRQLGSKYRDVTEMARIELEHEGWLYDGSLRGVDFGGADLSNADLQFAELSGVSLWGANLSGAYLRQANLSGADLRRANLSGAILRFSDLSGAHLVQASLSGADLRDADLSGAYLVEVGSIYTVVGANRLPTELSLLRADLPPDIVINPDRWKAVIIDSRTLRWSRD